MSQHSQLQGELLSLGANLVQLLNEILTQRSTLSNERQNYLYTRDHAEQASTELLNCISEGESHDSLQPTPKTLVGAVQEFKRCHSVLAVCQHNIKQLEDSLSRLEYRLMNQLTEFQKNLTILTSGPPILGDYNGTAAACFSDLPSSQINPPEEIHPLVQQYYDRRGDLTLLQDQLQEHDFEYLSEVARRESQRQLGLPLEISDIGFQDHYNHERDEIVKDLLRARNDMIALRQQCLNLGLHLDSSSSSRSGPGPSISGRSSNALKRAHEHEPSNSITHGNIQLIGSENLSTRINTWAEDIINKLSLNLSLPQLQFSKPGEFVKHEPSHPGELRESKSLSQLVIFPSSIQSSRSIRHSHLSWERDPPQRRLSDPSIRIIFQEGSAYNRGWTTSGSV